ncbi:MAG: HEPN domain-containing protein [Ignavibacteria bacterium]|nr:HEPN domain-containing protein [Ignavibacteria bacterium]
MNEIINEWIRKAEGDFNSAVREYRARKLPNYDAAGFHAQQCIEKYLKAILQMYNIPFQKIHDLLALMEMCLPIFPELEFHKGLLAYLNLFAVAFRYPGELANRDQAKRAVKAMKLLKPILRKQLDLPDE